MRLIRGRCGWLDLDLAPRYRNLSPTGKYASSGQKFDYCIGVRFEVVIVQLNSCDAESELSVLVSWNGDLKETY